MTEGRDGIELWFWDLNEKAQNELLAYAEVASPEEMNWDIYPVTTLIAGKEC